MNNYLYTIPNDWYNFKNIQQENYGKKEYDFLSSPKEGLQRGNLFNNLYEPYKNYKYKELVPTSKKQELMYNLLKYEFALNDLNLYLDIYPNNTELVSLYKKYLEEKNRLEDEYNRQYNPLTRDSKYIKTWDWLPDWPWEGVK